MLIGYARVSTGEQNPDLQQRALKAAGCERVFEDQVPNRGGGNGQALTSKSADAGKAPQGDASADAKRKR
jgi:hypothetical protein